MNPIGNKIDSLFYDNTYYPLYCKIDDRTDANDWRDVNMSLWYLVSSSVVSSVYDNIIPL